MFTKWKFLWWFVYEGTIGQRFGCGQWGGVTCSGHGGKGWGVRREVSGQVLDPSRGSGMTRGREEGMGCKEGGGWASPRSLMTRGRGRMGC